MQKCFCRWWDSDNSWVLFWVLSKMSKYLWSPWRVMVRFFSRNFYFRKSQAPTLYRFLAVVGEAVAVDIVKRFYSLLLLLTWAKNALLSHVGLSLWIWEMQNLEKNIRKTVPLWFFRGSVTAFLQYVGFYSNYWMDCHGILSNLWGPQRMEPTDFPWLSVVPPWGCLLV